MDLSHTCIDTCKVIRRFDERIRTIGPYIVGQSIRWTMQFFLIKHSANRCTDRPRLRSTIWRPTWTNCSSHTRSASTSSSSEENTRLTRSCCCCSWTESGMLPDISVSYVTLAYKIFVVSCQETSRDGKRSSSQKSDEESTETLTLISNLSCAFCRWLRRWDLYEG